MKKIIVLLFVIALLLYGYQYGRSFWHPVVVEVKGKRTVSEVVAKHEGQTRQDRAPLFTKAGISYPPSKLALVAFKDTNELELWASDGIAAYTLVKSYQIKAASGKLGPKLREGDRQVPEGLYKISAFNPNSSYHLSMKINYPNSFDLTHARAEGRNEPGTNIFIHGKAVSIGCLAMGDDAIEQLFTLVSIVGRANAMVLISPTDPSKGELLAPNDAPKWTPELYEKIKSQYALINQAYVVAPN